MKIGDQVTVRVPVLAGVVGPAKLNADELAKRDPQEMAVFAFLVGSGMSWESARQSENLDILEARGHGRIKS